MLHRLFLTSPSGPHERWAIRRHLSSPLWSSESGVFTGPIFKFSDTWQLVINTGTTIVTFLMVFLIQNTQNRESHAVQLKLDELIRAVNGAHNALLDLEGLEESDLERFRVRYEELARTARDALRRGELDTGTPEVKSG
ncbi:MAG: low affinity iron permease family protein [Candidatus Binatia bacterium]